MNPDLGQQTQSNPPHINAYYLSPEADAELRAESRRRRNELADRRVLRETWLRVMSERRAGPDRRSGFDRRFATMGDKLAAVADARLDSRFTGNGVTDFGLLGI